MNHQSLIRMRIALLASLLGASAPVNAAEDLSGDSATGVELICLTEQPVIVEGESATLRAWATTSDGQSVIAPISFVWEVDAGRVEAQEATTRWDLAMVKVEPEAARKVVATVRAASPGQRGVACSVEIVIRLKRDAGTTPSNGGSRGETLQSARSYLLPGELEAAGYGLYSYLLFSGEPRNGEEEQRYLKTLEAYLRVLDHVEDLPNFVPKESLNITYIPLREKPAPGNSRDESAAHVLSLYDYRTARTLLRRVTEDRQGPYLISALRPLRESSSPPHLWEDLTGVVPELAWDWVSFFEYLAAQERTWSDESLQRFALKVQNLIKVGGIVTPDVFKGVRIQFRD